MQTRTEAFTTFERGWIFRIRPGAQKPPDRIFVFLHGWTGDEKSMEIFARGMPDSSSLFFPRGPVVSPSGGYGWVSGRESWEAELADYAPVAESLLREIDLRAGDFGLSSPLLTMTGFSQGAAMTYALLALYPHRFDRAAALAGFLPKIPPGFDLSGVQGRPVYIAHGTRDETIPVEKARQAAEILHASGANVAYCENSGGHKLPTNCFSQLTRFLVD